MLEFLDCQVNLPNLIGVSSLSKCHDGVLWYANVLAELLEGFGGILLILGWQLIFYCAGLCDHLNMFALGGEWLDQSHAGLTYPKFLWPWEG